MRKGSKPITIAIAIGCHTKINRITSNLIQTTFISAASSKMC